MEKIVFTDLDGTLLDDNRLITKRNRESIEKALKILNIPEPEWNMYISKIEITDEHMIA